MSKTSSNNFLLRNAQSVLTGRKGPLARSNAYDIRVAAGVITEMGRALDRREDERLYDATDCVVYPGWVNTHHHLFQSLMKGLADGLDSNLFRWLRVVPYTYWDKLDEEALRMVGMAELALSGATTIADHHYIFSDAYDFDPAVLLF